LNKTKWLNLSVGRQDLFCLFFIRYDTIPKLVRIKIAMKTIIGIGASFPKEDIEPSKNITNSESNIIILSKLFTKSWDLYPDLDFSEEKLKTRINFCACGGDHCIDKPVESADCDSDFHLQETDNFEESQDKSIQYIINNSEIRSEHNRNHITKEVNQRGVPQNKHLKNCERYQGKERIKIVLVPVLLLHCTGGHCIERKVF
jgi:hypothetical protein